MLYRYQKRQSGVVRKSQSKKLQKVIAEGTTTYERWIHVHLLSVDEHTNHPTGDVSVLNFYLFNVFDYNLHLAGVFTCNSQ